MTYVTQKIVISKLTAKKQKKNGMILPNNIEALNGNISNNGRDFF